MAENMQKQASIDKASKSSQTIADLDLDLITKKVFRIKIGGKVVEIEAPTLESLLRLLKAVKKLKSIEGDDFDVEQIDKVLNRFFEDFYKIVPTLKDKKLSLGQLYTLIEFLIEKTQSTENQELKERGLTVSSKKKVASNSQEKLPDSSTTTPAIPSIS